MSAVAVRVFLVVAAIAAIAPLTLWLTAARDLERASDAGRSGDPAALDDAERRLRRAADRTPSTRPETTLAELLLFRRRPREAQPVIEDVLRREPENAEAWELLSLALARSDPERARRARQRERALRGGFRGG